MSRTEQSSRREEEGVRPRSGPCEYIPWSSNDREGQRWASVICFRCKIRDSTRVHRPGFGNACCRIPKTNDDPFENRLGQFSFVRETNSLLGESDNLAVSKSFLHNPQVSPRLRKPQGENRPLESISFFENWYAPFGSVQKNDERVSAA